MYSSRRIKGIVYSRRLQWFWMGGQEIYAEFLRVTFGKRSQRASKTRYEYIIKIILKEKSCEEEGRLEPV
jgi:hypothetical protein